MAEPLRSAAIAYPHGFLDRGQSDAQAFDLVAPAAAPVFVKQVHSPRVVTVDGPFADDDRPEADALVTAAPGTMLGIVTADCAPVLFADAEAGVIGAAHAGWRGAHHGVLEATVRRMEALGARPGRIAAAIGPTIAQDSYEVDWDFCEQFEERHDRFFRRGRRPGKWLFDLPAYVAWRLGTLSLAAIDDLALDTYADAARFHSFRRATHAGEATQGRQISLIALPG